MGERYELERRHLINLLSESKIRSVVVISAESGSGKTTLVSSYIRKSKIPCVWIDFSGDLNEASIFFNALGDKIKESLNITEESLPSYYPEYAQFLKDFSSNYLNTLKKIIGKRETTLVFDDMHHLDVDSPLVSFFEELIKQASENFRVFMLSREQIPLKVTDWKLERKLLRLNSVHLSMSEEEVYQFIKERFNIEPERGLIREILNYSGGFISRISLFEPSHIKNLGDTFKLFDSRIDENSLETLLKIAGAGSVTYRILEELEEREKIINLLEKIYSEGLPVRKTREGYVLHDSFKEYLMERGKLKLKGKYKDHISKMADILIRNGHKNEAITLLKEIGDVERIYTNFVGDLPGMISSGHIYTLGFYMKALKGTEFSEDPWVIFAEAVINKFERPDIALSLLKRAMESFIERKDVKGEKFALGELFDVLQYWGEDFSLAGNFLERAENLIESTGITGVEDIALLSYMGIAYLLYKGNSEKSAECFEKLKSIFGFMEEDQKTSLSYILCYTYIYLAIIYDTLGEISRAEIYFKESERLFNAIPKTPFIKFMFHFLSSIHEVFTGRFAESVKRMKDLEKELKPWENFLHAEHMLSRILEGLLCMGNSTEARKVFDMLDKIPYRTKFSSAMVYQLMCQYYLIEKDFFKAVDYGERSVNIFGEIKGKAFEMSTVSLLALAHAHIGNYNKGKELLKKTLIWSEENGAKLQEFTSLMYLSYILILENKKEEAKEMLKIALEMGRRHGFNATYNMYPELFANIVALALENDIERDYCIHLINMHRLEYPNTVPSENAWHWRIKIYTLGEFRVIKEGKEISTSDWKGTKALSLLKILLALGGKDVHIERIADILWTHYEGDKAMKNFEFTLRKLRSVLKTEGDDKSVILLKNKRLSLNEKLVWTDIWELNHLYEKAYQFYISGKKENIYPLMRRIRELYKGEFLEGEEGPLFSRVRLLHNKRYEFFKKFEKGAPSLDTA